MAEGESYKVSYDPSRTAANTGTVRNVTKEETIFSDGFKYTIFGKEFSAGSREQYRLMYDAFKELTNRYPDCVEKLTQRTSVAKAENVKSPGTTDSDPTYFRGYEAFDVNGQRYFVGSSYSLKDKIREIKGMFDICDADVSEFVLNGKPLEGGRKQNKPLKNDGGKQNNSDLFIGFEYILWGVSHEANKMSDMMHDVFDLIAEKYPEKIMELASSDYISAVARKEDVDGKKLPSSKLNYFRASREHNVGDEIYYVGTSYNRSQGIGQLERMLKLCEGSSDGFKISSSPDRVSHSGGMTGKKGLSENDMEYIVNNGKKD